MRFDEGRMGRKGGCIWADSLMGGMCIDGCGWCWRCI